MNVDRLKSLIDNLLKNEKEYRIQDALSRLNESLNNVINSPTDPQKQIELSSNIKSLSNQISGLTGRYTPAQFESMEAIGAKQYFSKKIVDDIEKWITQNPLTPAVVQQEVAKLADKRREYVQSLEAITKNFKVLNLEAELLEEGEAEIGFCIPRDLFNNNLEGLIKELRAIRHIICAFSELNGSIEPIEVKTISTSDPLFFFGLDVETIKIIGATITWAVVTLKEFEKVRKLRAQTESINIHTAKEIENFFDAKIEAGIKKAIEEKTTELVGKPEKAGRKEEQRTHLTQALESILARVERGMTVEIRLLPPKAPENDSDKTAQSKLASFDLLEEISKKLQFSPAATKPILTLPKPDDDPACNIEKKK